MEKLWAYLHASNERSERERAEERERSEREWAEERRRQAEESKRLEEERRLREEDRKRLEEEHKRRTEDYERQKESLDRVSRLFDQAEARIKATNAEVGGISNTLGEIVEHLVYPGIEKLFADMGLVFRHVSRRRKAIGADGKTAAEIDVMLENRDIVVAVEVKSKVSGKDVAKLRGKLDRLRECFREENDGRRILGAMAGAVFGESQRQEALDAGIYVLVQSGDTMRLDVPDGFEPRAW